MHTARKTILAIAVLLFMCAPASASVSVPPAPSGPATPSGGWKVAYADGFGASLGAASGQDNTLFPRGASGGVYSCSGYSGPFNSNEMQVFGCAKTIVDVNGLHLACNYTPNVATLAGHTENYTCGMAESVRLKNLSGVYVSPSGYRFFNFVPFKGQTWAIQARAQFPPNTGEEDPGWWSGDHPWTQENDFFEGYGFGAGADASWCHSPTGKYIGTSMPTVFYNTSTGAHVAGDDFICRDLGFDPSAGYHTYTTYFNGSRVSEYIDGKLVKWTYGTSGVPGTTSFTVPTTDGSYVGLILSHALRSNSDGNSDPYFRLGTRYLNFRYITVYENATANLANTVNAEIAPGTTVGP